MFLYFLIQGVFHEIFGRFDLFVINGILISSCTRPDISASTHILSKRWNNLQQRDWNSAMKLIRYLNGTKHPEFHISPNIQILQYIQNFQSWVELRCCRQKINFWMLNFFRAKLHFPVFRKASMRFIIVCRSWICCIILRHARTFVGIKEMW